MNNEIQNYLSQAREQGMSEEEIKHSLSEAGWPSEEINTALSNQREPTPPKKKHRIVKTILVTFGVIGFLVLFVLYLPNIYDLIIPDEKLIENEQLTLENIQVNNVDNAFSSIDSLASVVNITQAERNLLIDYVVKEEPVDESLIPAIVQKNEEAIRIFIEASQEPAFQHPDYTNSSLIKDGVVAYSPLRSASQLTAAKARLLAKTGQYDESVNLSLAVITFGEKMLEGQNPSITDLMGLAIRNYGLNSLGSVNLAMVSDKLILKTTSQLEDHKLSTELWKKHLAMMFKEQEKLINLFYNKDNQAIADWYNDPSYPPFRFGKWSINLITLPNKTINLYATEALRILDSPLSACNLSKEPPYQLPEPSLFESIYTKNSERNEQFNTWSRVIRSSLKKFCESQELHQVVQQKYQQALNNKPVKSEQAE